MVLLTDGKDFGSNISMDNLTYSLQESDTMIYSIFYETGFRRQNQRRRGGVFRGRQNQRIGRQNANNEKAADFLRDISDITAGRFYQNDIADLSSVFLSIAEELRKQYIIGYYPESVENGKVYRIKINIDKPGAVVRAKNTYRMKSE